MEPSNNTLEFNLAGILNILWRRRIIVLGLPALGLVVGLLYGSFGTKRWSATASVRPGITSFSPQGEPFRQWQLKDITTWYDKMMYRQELNDRLGLPRKAKQVIRTEFIATGLTNLAGGEVVTLWTTGTSPEQARAVIDTSIALFREYAESDTMSSEIQLTREGLKLNVEILQTRLMGVDKKEAALNLQLKAARADSLVVAVLDQELGIELEKLKTRQGFYQQRLTSLAEARPLINSQLAQVEKVLVGVAGSTEPAVDPSEIPAWARRDAVLDGGDVLGGLSDIRFRLQAKLDRNTALQDSFAYELELAVLEYGKRSMSREATVQAKLRDIERKIGDIELEKNFELPIKRREVANDINSRRIQIGSLTPMQRVGKTIVSDKPVRPRGLRATLILVFLGAVGGLVLGFTWDYVWANRQEIFRS
jgi:hypothetical protein